MGVKDIFLLNYSQVLFVFEYLYKNKKGKLLKIRYQEFVFELLLKKAQNLSIKLVVI